MLGQGVLLLEASSLHLQINVLLLPGTLPRHGGMIFLWKLNVWFGSRTT